MRGLRHSASIFAYRAMVAVDGATLVESDAKLRLPMPESGSSKHTPFKPCKDIAYRVPEFHILGCQSSQLVPNIEQAGHVIGRCSSHFGEKAW